jgi:GDP-L-fucose synthase
MDVTDSSPKRVAVLGGSGFAGRNLRDRLSAAGMSVAVFSRSTGCDLTELQTALAKVDAFRPDYLVNCAALVGSVNFVTDFAADVVDVNMRIVLNTYKIAQQMREVVVINPIANCAYPGVMDTLEEGGFWDGPIHPSVLSYGSTRRMMWVLSQCYRDQYGVRSVNLVVPNMYGPYDSTNPNKTHALNALVVKFVRALKYGHDEIEVWGTGRPVREWLYVGDFAEAVCRVIGSGDVSPDLLNIGQNRGYSITEIVAALAARTGFRGRVTYNTRFGDGSPKKVLDDRRFRQRFPDFEFTPLDDGLEVTLAYYTRIL